MKVLLDTHLLLWTLIEPHKLSAKAEFILQNTRNVFYYSTVSQSFKSDCGSRCNSGQKKNTKPLHFCGAAGR